MSGYRHAHDLIRAWQARQQAARDAYYADRGEPSLRDYYATQTRLSEKSQRQRDRSKK